MADVLKSVRIRGKEKPKKPGGLDGRLVLKKIGRDRQIIVYLSDTNTEYADFDALTFDKRGWGDKSDSEIISEYLTKYPTFSIIQDPFNPANIPADPNYTPPAAGATASSGVTASVAGVTASNTGTASTSTLATAPTPQAPINKFITGKVKITKKSGPGEITGITELDLTDTGGTGTTNATFKGLQFTEGGDYVLSITCTSENVEPMELKVKVIKEDDIVAQPDSKGSNTEQKPVDGNRSIIAQIDKPTIKVPPIVINKDDTVGSGGQSDYTQGLGYTPLIWYKAFAIEDRYITNLRLYHDGLIPKIDFTFEDTKDIIKSIGMPTDDSTIDLFLNSSSSNLKSLHIVFKIESFDQGPDKVGQKFTISGTMNIPNLYLVGNNSYNDTSFNTLRKICGELEIGFNSNISNTEDKMAWKNTQKKIYEFMSDIVARSYINDESFMGGYIDYYYCFNYVDIEKEMTRDNSKDVGIDTSGVSQQSTPDELNRIIPLTLTNDQSQSSSSNYMTDVIKVNDSTKKSLKHGYATITKFYDRIKKQFLVFTVDSTTSDGNKSIILKGGENDDKYQKENIKHKFAGKIDTDNVHSNFNYASTQNRINLDNLNKIAINATLPNANWNLYKFQKVEVQMVNKSSTPANPSPIDFRYSGSYIVADIEYVWSRGKMSQKVRLVRKELGKTPDEIKNGPPVQKKPEVKENNFNPTGTSSVVPAPNEVYSVGQTYLVQDKNGKLYNITVTKLLEDGVQVTGTLVESPVGMSQSSTSNTVPVGINPATASAPPPTAPTKPTEPTEFTLAVSNAITEADKKISGVVNITRQGPQRTATGTVSGFSDGGTVGPLKGEPVGSGVSDDKLVNEMIKKLESSITIKYSKEFKLIITGKK
jgi:hypothetical protein